MARLVPCRRWPTTLTFSPSLLPAPNDYPPHVVVSGPLLLTHAAAAPGARDATQQPPPPRAASSHQQQHHHQLPGEVQAFLDAPGAPPPVLISLGSASGSCASPDLATNILLAAALSGTRLLVHRCAAAPLSTANDEPALRHTRVSCLAVLRDI